MPATTPQTGEVATLDTSLSLSIRQKIQGHLEREKRRIYEEIQNYPPPIPACDAQFNYLLEQRNSLTQEYNHLNAIFTGTPHQPDSVSPLIEFIQASHFLDDVTKQEMVCSLNADNS